MTTKTALQVGIALGTAAVAAARLRRAVTAIDFAGKVVVIFGGSRGLGLVMARALADEGAHLVLAARDADELERARHDVERYGAPVTTLVCDVTNRQQVRETIAAVVAKHSTIDVLVNDAGVIQVGPFAHMTAADFETALATHFWGPFFTIDAALPHMRRAGARRIVNISSVGGKISVPHLLPYCTSKFALVGFSDGLRSELAPEGFAVTTVCPGLMRTGSTYNATFKGLRQREFVWFHLLSSLPGLTIDAERAARQIIGACRHGDPELVITLPAKVGVALNAVAPGVMARVLTAANWLLPPATGEEGDAALPGWQSTSPLARWAWTALADRASIDNNEWPTPVAGT
jgi:NAD(P)-dependent dehydrogenase (short-subunit alcohol dehydrogenase family)